MAQSSELKGYDSYSVSLGDEMRGARASMGKSLLDVQRDLKIKAAHIDAIENARLTAFPETGFVTGYVRAYARYLGMDEHEVLRRFRDEAGEIEPESVARVTPLPRTGRPPQIDAALAASRLGAASRASAAHADLGALMRGLGSLATLAALVGGLGYGGWALLQNIQRVDFAPTPDAPAALAEAPMLDGMTRIAQASVAPAPAIDAEALAEVYAAQDAPAPRMVRRDGPIAAIDPAAAGIYAPKRRDQAPVIAQRGDDLSRPDPAFRAELARMAENARTAETAPAAPAAAPDAPALALVFEGEAWIRVRDGAGKTVHQALMQKGARWIAPEGADGLRLRAGNAGGVFVELGGERFGPFGKPGGVVSKVALDPAALRATLPALGRPAADQPAATIAAAQP